MIELSIIIPVYNVEKYVKRCIESVLNQWQKEFEIILVDDGSLDQSGVICEDYKERYPFIRVIHQKNKGLSEARNTGIRVAKGQYLAFLDSDDFVKNNSYQKMLKIIKEQQVDIVVGEAVSYVDDNHIYLKKQRDFLKEGKYDAKEFLVNCLKDDVMVMCVPFNLYRKELIIDNNLFFERGLLHEDELWTPQIFLNAMNIYYCKDIFYYHYTRADSITQRKDLSKNGQDLLYICNKLDDMYSLIEGELGKLLRDYLSMIYMGGVYSGKLYRKDRRSLIDKRFPLCHAYRRNTLIKAYIFRLNLHLFCVTYYLFNCFKRKH
ncbi:MAG: glycosyltransferase [Lachnospiraceae bacterium]|nr:glycosyltransferase [Lachnospiraceae bacterium]